MYTKKIGSMYDGRRRRLYGPAGVRMGFVASAAISFGAGKT